MCVRFHLYRVNICQVSFAQCKRMLTTRTLQHSLIMQQSETNLKNAEKKIQVHFIQLPGLQSWQLGSESNTYKENTIIITLSFLIHSNICQTTISCDYAWFIHYLAQLTDNQGGIIGFVHTSDVFVDGTQLPGFESFKSVGLACSSDYGVSWNLPLKRILTVGEKPTSTQWSGTGDQVYWQQRVFII